MQRMRSTWPRGTEHPARSLTTASAATAAPQTAVAHTMSSKSPRESSRLPLSETMKAIGARKAGRVYLQACIIVGITLPPVIAAEATAASAVGGDTSDSTA